MSTLPRTRRPGRLVVPLLAPVLFVAPIDLAAQADGGALIERMQKATVQVLCDEGWGSGFVVATPRTVVTNAHVVSECSNPRVRAFDGAIATARIVVVDEYKDVAVLEVDGTPNAAAAALRSDGAVKVGEEVFALGFPRIAQRGDGDIAVQSPMARVTRGPVSRPAYPQNNGERFVIDHSAGIYHGNSGGPLFDACGRVVGVNSEIGIDTREQFYGTVGFAVGTRSIAEVLTKAGLSAPLAGDGCTVPFGTIVGATVAATKGVSPGAEAAAARLEASYRKYQKQYDAKWDSLQQIIAQGDSTETARAQKVEQGISGLLDGLSAKLNSNIAGVNDRVDGVEQQLKEFEDQFRKWLIILSVVVTILAAVLAFVFWKQRAQGTALAGIGGRVEGIDNRLRDLEDKLHRQADRAVEVLAKQDAKGGRDAKAALEILLTTPGYTADSMSNSLRTRVASTVLDGQNDRATRPARTEADRTRVARTQTGGLVVELVVKDGPDAAPRTITLPVGYTAYIGRDERTLSTVAEGFAVQPVMVALSPDDRVSRCHLAVLNEGDGVRITDLSLNGTFAQGPLNDIRRSDLPFDSNRRSRPELLERGDSVKISRTTSFSLARPDSGYTIDVRVSGTPAFDSSNN